MYGGRYRQGLLARICTRRPRTRRRACLSARTLTRTHARCVCVCVCVRAHTHTHTYTHRCPPLPDLASHALPGSTRSRKGERTRALVARTGGVTTRTQPLRSVEALAHRDWSLGTRPRTHLRPCTLVRARETYVCMCARARAHARARLHVCACACACAR